MKLVDSRLEQLKQRLRNPLGTLAKGDGGGAYQQAVQQSGQRWTDGGAAYQQAVHGQQYTAEPPRISGGRPQLEDCSSEADAGVAPSSLAPSGCAGQEQPQGDSVAYQERKEEEEEEEEERDRLLREKEGDMFDFEADLMVEEGS